MQFVLSILLILLIGNNAAAQTSRELQARLNRAQKLFSRQQFSEVIPELEEATKLQPKLPGAYYQLGYAYWRLGRNAEAIQAFTKELSFPPPDPYSLYYLARIYLDRDDLLPASQYLERAVNAGGVLDARERLGSTYLKLGRIDDAILVLAQALQRNPTDDSAHYVLGRAYQRKGETAQAEREFDLAIKYKSAAQHATAALLHLNSELKARNLIAAAATARELEASRDPEAMVKAGQALGEAGLTRDSVDLFKGAAELQPQSADAEYDLGRAYAALNEVDQSIDSLKKAVELKPAMYEAELLLGTMLVDAGRGTEAITYLRKAAGLRPDNPRLLTMLGLQYLDGRYYREASQALQTSIKLEPDNPDPYFLLIQVEYRSDRYEAALNLARSAVKRFPDRAMSHYHYGVQLQNLNHLDEARTELEKTIRMDPGLTGAAVTLGEVLYKLGKPEESLVQFKSVLARDESQMDAWSGLGKALIELRKYEDAKATMTKAIALDGSVPSLHLYLSQALRALGISDESKREAAVFNTLTLRRATARDNDAERSYAK